MWCHIDLFFSAVRRQFDAEHFAEEAGCYNINMSLAVPIDFLTDHRRFFAFFPP